MGILAWECRGGQCKSSTSEAGTEAWAAKETKIKANIHLLLVAGSSQGLRGPLAWRIELSSPVPAEGRTVWSTGGLHRPTSLFQHAVADLCRMYLAVKERNEEEECTVPLKVL